MESVNIQNVADVAETHIENRLNVQQKERFVTTVEKKSLRCMLQRKTSNALSCRKFSKQRKFKKWRNWKPSDLLSRVC